MLGIFRYPKVYLRLIEKYNGLRTENIGSPMPLQRAIQGKDHEQENGGEGLRKFIVGDLPTVMYIPNFITESEQNHIWHQINTVPMSKWKTLKNRRLQNWGGVVHEKGLLPQALPSWLSTIIQKICDWTKLFPSPINHVLINEYLPGQGIMPHQDGPAYFPVVAIISLGSPAVMCFTPHPKLLSSTDSETSSSDQAACTKSTTPLTSLHDGKYEQHQTRSDRSEEDVRKQTEHKIFSVALMPGSLLIFKDSAYKDYLHGIEECSVHEFDEVINADAVVGDIINNVYNTKLVTDHSTNIEVLGLKKKSSISRTGTRISLTCRLVPKVNKSLIKL
ncbi:alkylated DNA repair protein ALKBH6 homolog isoform X1 [Cryptomeria japonica]|uniref:alkylated DNA repair protein ALKBH6 homolog isoform X1 n=2 Tax=Cryptomeria japonica TaxID=3369 RepID=UPI0025AD849D|nr:alkylated DNA repair protein ALKBH6 homolog isoform X1 [Cryptomeria japonica]